ncbi:MAG: fumarylacetoacetate hydrolase family protein, partial [Xanthobacteraceae bacterium]
MKLAVYKHDGTEHLGFISGDTVVDPNLGLAADAPERAFFADTVAFIRSAGAGRAAAERMLKNAPASARLPLDSLELAAPVRPSTILCSGSNYRDHNREKLNTPISGKEPEFFIKTADCVVGPNEPIVYDAAMSKKLDMETELAVVIGKAGRHIPLASALDHLVGSTARDRQVRTSPEGSTWYELGRSKSFDCSAPLGPVIVTAEEIGDPQALKLQTRINGELRQSSNTRNMIWGCADLVH